MTKMHNLGSFVLLAAAGGLLVGCGKDSERPKYRPIEGRITAIDLDTGVVKMKWYNPKKKEEVEISGKLAPNAELLINGETARLQDLHVDDQVRVTGREDEREGIKQLVATQVEVTREEVRPVETSTQPGDKEKSRGGAK